VLRGFMDWNFLGLGRICFTQILFIMDIAAAVVSYWDKTTIIFNFDLAWSSQVNGEHLSNVNSAKCFSFLQKAGFEA
jgi:hypothetical protein